MNWEISRRRERRTFQIVMNNTHEVMANLSKMYYNI